MKTIHPTLGVTMLLALALLAGGCTTVDFKQPVGRPSAEAAAALRGAWLLDESEAGLLLIAPVAGEEGKVHVSAVEIKGNKGFTLDHHTGIVTRLGDDKELCYLHLSDADEAKADEEAGEIEPAAAAAAAEAGNAPRFSIILLRVKKSLVTAWPVNPQAIADAIEKKELPGTVIKPEGGKGGLTIHVDADKEALDAYFLKHGKTLFTLESPVIARRVATLKDED